MNCIRLGLLGKNISHSKSPDTYRVLLHKEVDYRFFDFNHSKEISSLDVLYEGLHGLNITAPYKRHFINEVHPSEIACALGAINCIKKKKGTYFGTLTDYYAVGEIFNSFTKLYKITHVFILGDGIMAKISEKIIKAKNISFEILSRKKIDYFDSLNLKNASGEGILIINACSREYAYKGTLNKKTLFWDYNYNFDKHKHIHQLLGKRYIDGMGLLYKQAKYSLEFLYQ